MPFVQNLPDLADYRLELIKCGAPEKLPLVPFRSNGLLEELPPPPDDRYGWPWDTQSRFPANPSDAPVISIVTPSYQQGDYLEETIRSVLLQNYPRLEFVLMDGGSNDQSKAVIEKYRPWISFARSGLDRGQSHAINQGFSLINGDICGWLNSDDFYLPGTFSRIAEAWQRGFEFIYGDSLELNQETGKSCYTPANFAHRRYLRFGGLVIQPSTFWSTEKHQPIWEEQHCALDYELWIRLLPGLRIGYLNHPLSVARRHVDAKTYSPKMKARWMEDAKRNGLAHPRLYRKNRRSQMLDIEFRLVQRLSRRCRGRGMAERLAALCHECHWPVQSVSL